MQSGLLYVVFNKWITDPDSGQMPYKIGITKNTVDERYYGLGLKMPGSFDCLFAYEFLESELKDIEDIIHKTFKKERINGEWFTVDSDQLKSVEFICKGKGGNLVTKLVEDEIEKESNLHSSKIIYHNQRIYNQTKSKDNTQYRYKKQTLGKSRLVLEIVKDYVKQNPNVSFKELETIFNPQLQGSSGVFADEKEAIEIFNRTGHKRYFLNNNEIIELQKGERIAVSNQWKISNIDRFISKARILGFEIN